VREEKVAAADPTGAVADDDAADTADDVVWVLYSPANIDRPGTDDGCAVYAEVTIDCGSDDDGAGE
jgi:hypothetical protein